MFHEPHSLLILHSSSHLLTFSLMEVFQLLFMSVLKIIQVRIWMLDGGCINSGTGR